jgi:hypothetical protein
MKSQPPQVFAVVGILGVLSCALLPGCTPKNQIHVTGKVQTEDGRAVPGVSVESSRSPKDSTFRATTDEAGEYRMYIHHLGRSDYSDWSLIFHSKRSSD